MNYEVFDAHFHIIDPAFPLAANQGFLPEPFTVADYRARTSGLEITGGAVVAGSFQGHDQNYLTAALERLGRGFAGVAQLPASVADDEILRLDAKGVRAVRFNVKRGGPTPVDLMESFARRVHDVARWHAEFYVDAGELGSLESLLLRLPAASIDHLGLSKAGLPAVLRLAEQGVRVKASGFGRVDFPVAAALREIHAANPHALMFGTDLPSTRAPRPFHPDDLTLVVDALGDEGAGLVLRRNAMSFYRLPGTAT